MNELPVQRRTALCRRRQQPNDQDHFHLIVEGEPGEENVRECFYAREEGEHDPVHHPLDLKEIEIIDLSRSSIDIRQTYVFLHIARPYCLIRGVGGVKDAKEQSENGVKYRFQNEDGQ